MGSTCSGARTHTAHGAASANTAKTTGTKKELGIFAKTQTKAHLMCETVLTESSDEGGALEEKGVDSCLKYNSGEDSDWTSSDIDSESTDLEKEDILPFHCDECGRISNLRYGSNCTWQKGCIRSVQLA